MLVDSHCHIDCLTEAFDESIDQLMANAVKAGVHHFLCVCITLDDYPKMLEIAKQYDNVKVSVGIHPNTTDVEEPTAEQLVELANAEPLVVAIGETGLDYYRTDQKTEWQQTRFRRHIQAAKAVQLPIIVHSRHAREDTITILSEEKASDVGGVMHCFTEDWNMAKQALDLGMYISFSGIVTFKNAAEVQEVARKVPLDRMLIETDCPYLAPVPFRGKPNQPAYVKHVAEYIAELRSMPYQDIAKMTTDNYFNCFPRAK